MSQYVINLCSLDTPITVPQPRASRLARYSFFISHSWENERRQYRLHMGYFQSKAEADKWLVTLRRIYPTAHVSEAPEQQPDLMTNTQRLRILNLGQIDATTPASAPVARFAAPAGAASSVKSSSGVHATGRRYDPSLEKTLEELRTSQFDMGEDDDLNSTGVRHLRFEVQRDGAKAQPAQKPGPRARK
jgi:hypothetical protein